MTGDALVEVRGLTKVYQGRGTGSDGRRRLVHAVTEVDLDIARGEILGLVGESGSGKTTTGFMLARLERPTGGRIAVDGVDLAELRGRELRRFRRNVQVVFQDPADSLNPRHTVRQTLAEPLQVQRLAGRRELDARVAEALETVELTPAGRFMTAYPHELSGGQRQRVAIARAIVTRPKLLVADEPVSMLDVSVRVGVLNLMLRLRSELGMAYLFITHDLAVARYMCDRVAVMYLGRIVEEGPTEEILERPRHPYSRLLLSAVPVPDPTAQRRRAYAADGAVPSAAEVPAGCAFHPRCPEAMDRCRTDLPAQVGVGAAHRAACHLYGDAGGGAGAAPDGVAGAAPAAADP